MATTGHSEIRKSSARVSKFWQCIGQLQNLQDGDKVRSPSNPVKIVEQLAQSRISIRKRMADPPGFKGLAKPRSDIEAAGNNHLNTEDTSGQTVDHDDSTSELMTRIHFGKWKLRRW